jgi:hypothetical protein
MYKPYTVDSNLAILIKSVWWSYVRVHRQREYCMDTCVAHGPSTMQIVILA